MKKIKKIFISFLCILSLSSVFTFPQEVDAVIMPLGVRLMAKEAKEIESNLPSRIKKSNGEVDLGQFKDKNGRTPLNKNAGTFKSTKDSAYTVEKDTAGHGGRALKLFKNGKRIASLSNTGRVLSK